MALIAVTATAFGVTCERRFEGAPRAGRGVLTLMLFVLVPFVSFVNIAHLQLTAGAAAGLGLAYIAVGIAGFAAWAIGRRWLRLSRPDLGALICTVIVVNSGSWDSR